MQRHQIFLFPRVIQHCHVFLGRLVVLIFKVLFLVVTGFRRLKVERAVVNSAFLLSKGFVVVHWQARNVLWVRVQGRWVGGRSSQVLMLKAAEMPFVISIHIQGLFSYYRRRFVVHPLAALKVEEPMMFLPEISGVPDSLCPVFTDAFSWRDVSGNQDFTLDVCRIEIHLPIFQTETIYEPKLLS